MTLAGESEGEVPDAESSKEEASGMGAISVLKEDGAKKKAEGCAYEEQ